jgi:hypothetical protein
VGKRVAQALTAGNTRQCASKQATGAVGSMRADARKRR